MQDPDRKPGTRKLRRRDVLAGGTAMVALAPRAEAQSFAAANRQPATAPPVAPRPGPWRFFTDEEGRAVEAIVDRLIPPDPETPGGKQAGCAFFIDRQLAGPYGRAEGLYMEGPFQEGTKTQGDQSHRTPGELYRDALSALTAYCHDRMGGRHFEALSPEEQDELLKQMEARKLRLGDVDAGAFFEQILENTKEGFFADPVYGGNRDMAGWKMIGFPGARYDHRSWVELHNTPYNLPPVAIGLPRYGGK
jgi:gluconate 2-dehydrogenase gamma chain